VSLFKSVDWITLYLFYSALFVESVLIAHLHSTHTFESTVVSHLIVCMDKE
jgi:hypothetical protein